MKIQSFVDMTPFSAPFKEKYEADTKWCIRLFLATAPVVYFILVSLWHLSVISPRECIILSASLTVICLITSVIYWIARAASYEKQLENAVNASDDDPRKAATELLREHHFEVLTIEFADEEDLAMYQKHDPLLGLDRIEDLIVIRFLDLNHRKIRVVIPRHQTTRLHNEKGVVVFSSAYYKVRGRIVYGEYAKIGGSYFFVTS